MTSLLQPISEKSTQCQSMCMSSLCIEGTQFYMCMCIEYMGEVIKMHGYSPHDEHLASGPRPVKLCSDQ